MSEPSHNWPVIELLKCKLGGVQMKLIRYYKMFVKVWNTKLINIKNRASIVPL